MFDFPTAPPAGTTIGLPDGTWRSWDGVKWRASIQPPLGSGVFLPLAGGIMQGQLLLQPTDPAGPDAQAATKAYVNTLWSEVPTIDYLNSITAPPIEAFSSAIVGDGVTDDSTAIKAAHDAAFAAGVREVYCARTYNAPNAWNLGNVLFRGPGRLIGTYRKRIIPYGLRAGIIPPAGLALSALAAATAPVAVIWGDSTGTRNAGGHISVAEALQSQISSALIRDNPGVAVNWFNRSIGGSDLTDYNRTGTQLAAAGRTMSGADDWFLDMEASWSSYISALAPDLVIVNWGTNSPIYSTFGNINTVVSFLLGLPKRPDIIWCTNLPQSTQGTAGSAMRTNLEYRDNAAGAIRSYCYWKGIGCLDFHRAACMARDAFDPCSPTHTKIASWSNATKTLPVTFPETESDFDVSIEFDNTASAAFGAGQTYDLLLSPQAGNVLRLGDDGAGKLTLAGLTGSGATEWLPGGLVTDYVIPTTTFALRISLSQSWIGVYKNDVELVFEGRCFRHGGIFSPTLVISAGTGVTSVKSVQYSSASATLVEPVMTDAEMFGSAPYAQGGNSLNHPASPYYGNVTGPMLAQTSFARSLYLPVQGGTVTGAITISGAAGSNRNLFFATAGVARWRVGANTFGEGAGSSGSDFVVERYDNTGALIDVPLSIARSNNQISMPSGLLTVGSATLAAGIFMHLNTAAGQPKRLRFLVAGSSRWELTADNTAESGSNAGTNFQLARYSDAGALLSNSISIDRASGLVTLGNALRITGGVGFYNTAAVTTKPVVSGSRGANAALASLLTQLASLGLVSDTTVA